MNNSEPHSSQSKSMLSSLAERKDESPNVLPSYFKKLDFISDSSHEEKKFGSLINASKGSQPNSDRENEKMKSAG